MWTVQVSKLLSRPLVWLELLLLHIASSTSIQVYQAGSFSFNSYVSFVHYNETGTTNIGLPATVFQTAYEDSLLFSRDACARTLIDCTSSSMDISIKTTANVGNFNYINYNTGTRYAGMGRTVIFQLENAS